VNDPLFDVDPYIDPSVKPKRQRVKPAGNEDDRPLYLTDDEGWTVVATLDGTLPEAHLGGLTANIDVSAGAFITKCDIVGRAVHRLGPNLRAYLCVECITRHDTELRKRRSAS
jgi:hypothetical protein